MDPGPGERLLEVMNRLAAARLEYEAQRRQYQAAMAQLQVTLDQVRNGRSRREILHDSAFARLQARLDTLPVIEQAKGIVMAQSQCGAEDAFDLLRRASQSANIKVSVLAERIVKQAAARDSRAVARALHGASAEPTGRLWARTVTNGRPADVGWPSVPARARGEVPS